MLPKYDTLVEKIKEKRRELGWSQKTLAERAGVSKSLVGKLERGDNIPNYENVCKIYNAFEEKKNSRAEDYMNEDIVSVEVEDKIKKAAEIMNDNDFSQLPVKRNNNYIGLITSTDIASKEDREKPIQSMKLHSLPVIPYDTPKEDFTDMFNTHQAVLIKSNRKTLGMITPADLL